MNDFYKYERLMISFGFAWSDEDNLFIKEDDNYIPKVTVEQAKQMYKVIYDD